MSEIATRTVSSPAETRSAAPELPLVEYFERFYERVVRMKRALVSAEAETGLENAKIAQQELLGVLGQQSAEARGRYGAGAVEVLEQAHYVMAALADETFIHMEWPCRELWRDSLLLEASLFGTYRAGDEIFRRIDEITVGRGGSGDLATLLLMTLGLGFEGKFRRTTNGAEELALYRRRLMVFMARRHPQLGDSSRRLMPQAYEHTSTDEVPEEIPDPRRWIFVLAGVLAAWLLVGHAVWLGLTEDLTPILNRIVSP